MVFSYTKLACVLLVCITVAAPAAEAAFSCSLVSEDLAQCLPYLKGGSSPSSACCSGVKALASQATTSSARQTACGCLKSTAASVDGLVPAKAASLPSKCNVNVGYPISASVDCSTVH